MEQDINPASIRTALANRALNSIEALYSSTVWLGLWSRVGALPQNIKGIPALRFEPEYGIAQDYCRTVVKVMRAQPAKTGTANSKPLFDMAAMYKRQAAAELNEMKII